MKEKIKVLVLIDCQNDFIDGSLANKDAQACIPAIVEKIKNFDGDAIFFTMDSHKENYLDTPEGKKLPVKHCIYDTLGWGLNKDIFNAIYNDVDHNKIKIRGIYKPTFASVVSFDNGKNLFNRSKTLIDEVLELEKGTTTPIPMEIEMCGFCTDICVISNALALKGFTYDFAEITVDSKCCAGVTPEKHEAALEVMRSCQINVI